MPKPIKASRRRDPILLAIERIERILVECPSDRDRILRFLSESRPVALSAPQVRMAEQFPPEAPVRRYQDSTAGPDRPTRPLSYE